MTIVDTTVRVDYFRDAVTPKTSWLDRELGLKRIGLTDLVLCEVLQAVRSETRFRFVNRELANLAILATGGVSCRPSQPLSAAGHCGRGVSPSGKRSTA